MGLLDKIKDNKLVKVFYDDGGNPISSNPPPEPPPTKQSFQVISNLDVTTPAPATIVDPLAVDPKNVECLNQILKDSNLPGPDYIEFKEFLDGLLEIGSIPEQAAYMGAYNQWVKLPNSGGNNKKILDSIQTYINILDKERDNYKTEEHNKITVEIDANNIKIESGLKKINELDVEMKKVTKEVNDLKQRNIDLTEKSSKSRILFENSLNYVKNMLNEVLTKLTTYVK